MPIEFGGVLTGQIFIDGETGPIGWSGIQTVSTLLPDDYLEESHSIEWADFNDLRHPLTFTCDLRLSKKFKRALILGWRAKGPYRKRLIERLKRARSFYNWTLELRSDET